MFLHDNKYQDNNEIEIVKMKKENESIAGKLVAIENSILELDTKKNHSEAIVAKLEKVEKRYE